MFSVGKQLVALASMPLATAGFALPAQTAVPAHAVAASVATTLPAPELGLAPVPIDTDYAVTDASAPAVASTAPLAVAGDPAARIVLLIAAAATDWSAEPATVAPVADAAETAKLDAEVECIAKVVVHEAGNQSRKGQLAVAQLIMNRIESGRFPATACGVANQPGQFFRTADYNPPRNSATWSSAVEVAREAREGTSEKVVPGALFFQAAYASTGSFFRSRQRVATLGDHVFYR